MLEQGFFEKYLRQPVTNERMTLVSNLQEFNNVIFFNKVSVVQIDIGFHLQTIAYYFDKIKGHLNPNPTRIGSRHTYTLHRFIYAFKIWICETFPNSSIVGSPILGVIPGQLHI
uniref:Uncharacterized protein n=1 Tax=Lactuca sativa TaxID=4236 RepID=A0A9R1XIH0_LACSA|nr:hypothetical protein LSAT_V11C300138900 [Lactuca sativa]